MLRCVPVSGAAEVIGRRATSVITDELLIVFANTIVLFSLDTAIISQCLGGTPDRLVIAVDMAKHEQPHFAAIVPGIIQLTIYRNRPAVASRR